LVNNAGITRDAPFHKMTPQQWHECIDTNLNGVFNMTHTVNVVAPGYINTEMMSTIPEKVMNEVILPQIPVGRLGEASEIARTVAFLTSDDAGFITGSTISANGGQYMS